jgi:hypothetical protein
MAFQYRPPDALKITGSAVATNWARFKEQWSNFEIATDTSDDDKAKRAAAFLTCIGNEAYDVFRAFQLSDTDKKDIDKVIAAFEEFCVGKVNVTYERYLFNQHSQEPNERFDVFLGELRRLAKSCKFEAMEDSLIRDRIVVGLRDDATRRKLLAQRDLSLNDAIDVCRASEQASRQLKAMTTDEVSATSMYRDAHSGRKQQQHWRDKSEKCDKSVQRDKSVSRPDTWSVSQSTGCRSCGKQHEKRYCPAYGKTCSYCNKQNHFASVCFMRRNKQSKREVCNNDDSDVDELLSLNDDAERWYTRMKINGRTVCFMLDSGATANILPISLVNELGRRAEVRPTLKRIRMFDKTELNVFGIITLPVGHLITGKSTNLEFYVANRHEQAILGCKACKLLDLLKPVNENICVLSSNPLSTATCMTEQDVINEYADQ